MKEYAICKSCGFIMDKRKIKDKCPACGVNSSMFVPHGIKISVFRKFILSMDIHPVVVHFPQAFMITILVLTLFELIFKGVIQEKILSTIVVLGFALPFVTITAICAGLLDGKIRFHKVTTYILIRKMILGSFFFIFSVGIFILTVLTPLNESALWMIVGLAIPATGCSVFLGLLGSSIYSAVLPG
jgi:hypothetical protein